MNIKYLLFISGVLFLTLDASKRTTALTAEQVEEVTMPITALPLNNNAAALLLQDAQRGRRLANQRIDDARALLARARGQLSQAEKDLLIGQMNTKELELRVLSGLPRLQVAGPSISGSLARWANSLRNQVATLRTDNTLATTLPQNPRARSIFADAD